MGDQTLEAATRRDRPVAPNVEPRHVQFLIGEQAPTLQNPLPRIGGLGVSGIASDKGIQGAERVLGGGGIAFVYGRQDEEVAGDLLEVAATHSPQSVGHLRVIRAALREGAEGVDGLDPLLLLVIRVGDAQLGQGRELAVGELVLDRRQALHGFEIVLVLVILHGLVVGRPRRVGVVRLHRRGATALPDEGRREAQSQQGSGQSEGLGHGARGNKGRTVGATTIRHAVEAPGLVVRVD